MVHGQGLRGGRRRGQVLAAALVLVVGAGTGACGTAVGYTDELVDHRTGRSQFVTVPASFGGVTGFVAGVPIDIVALPVTYSIYALQKERRDVVADPTSTLLFPSFALGRVGTFLLGSPFDVLEFMAVRAWRPPRTLTQQEQEQLENELDLQTLASYPVEVIPPPRVEDGRIVDAAPEGEAGGSDAPR